MQSNLVRLVQARIEWVIRRIYSVLVTRVLEAHIVRLSLMFLDVWQAISLYYNDNIIDLLIGQNVPSYSYMPLVYFMAFLSVWSLFSLSSTLALLLIGLNILEFMFFTFSSLVYSSDVIPLFGVGLFIFITLVSIGAFLRVLLLRLRRYR